MGFFDDIVAQQDGGGMLGGLPATWQYTNPESLSPTEKQMMAMVGTQNPDKAGFAPLPASTGAFPVNGTAPITGLGGDTGQAAPTIGAPPPANLSAFNTGATPALFVNPPGATPGNPMMPPPASAPIAASDDGEDDAPAAAPAAPVAIGNYQMPRVGTADQFKTDPAALPANAQAVQGLGAPGQAAAPNIGDNLMAGYQNLRHGGGIIGSIVAAVTGRRNDAAGVAQQQQTQIANQTANALVKRGVPQDVAIAAVQPGNGEMLKSLVTQVFGGPKAPTVLGNGYIYNNDTHKVERAYEPDSKRTFTSFKRQDGSEVPGVFDPDGNDGKGSFTPIQGVGTGGVNEPVGLPGDINKTGPEYVATIPDIMKRKTVEGLIDGTAQIPRITTKNQQQWEELFAMAKQADPTFDSALYGQRVAGRKDFMGGGKSAEMVRSANQTVGHIGDLIDKADALHNRSFTPWNYVANHADSMFGGDAQNNWMVNAHAVADEIGKLFKGNNLSDSEIKQWADNLTPNMSPTQQRGAMKNLMSLMDHSVNALEEKRLASIGPVAAEKAGPLMTPESQKILERVRTWAGGEAKSEPAVVPTLKVGQSVEIGNGVTIKKVSDK
jgi:hypothetical protein